jgi:hypothetical protein
VRAARDISGNVKDEEFSAAGEAAGSPETGEFRVRLDYRHVPSGWHPHMYPDVKVSLLFLREEDGGQNFLTLAGGQYTSAGTIDVGDCNVPQQHGHQDGGRSFLCGHLGDVWHSAAW